ncbi:MAG TPA: hypothetical protein VFS30_18470 [Dehalococcoidia bacterium]|nr:hypothetical protein [Dehalococcoidia bacterium]
MRSKLLAFALAVLAMVVIVVIAIVAIDDDAEAPSNAATASPTPSASQTPAASPTPEAREPTFAPDGRTGIAELDRIIDDFVRLDAGVLAAAYPDVILRDFNGETDDLLPAPDWAARLVSSERSLYSVARERDGSGILPARQFNITLRVTEAGEKENTWFIAVQNESIVDLLGNSGPPSPHDVTFSYELFLVLPPRSELPLPPASHALTITTGDSGVDALISLLAAHDGDGLVAAAAMPLTRIQCSIRQAQRDDVATRELGEIAAEAIGIHAVAVLPEGYQPAADHLIMVVLEVSPYRWRVAGLMARDGSIVGFDICDTDRPTSLYPPRSYPAPPVADLTDLDPARRSGIEVIDTFLNALAAGDLSSMVGQVSYEQVGCILEPVGIGGPPFCEDGEAEGTLLDVVLAARCEGHYIRREAMPQVLGDLVGKPWALYAVIELGPPVQDAFVPGTWQVILVDIEAEEDSFLRTISPWFTEEGLSGLLYTCGQGNPSDLERRGTSPEFLLPPR